jgi:hypothetical protein
MKEFKVGDAVRVSAAFLRSICPSAARGWPTRYDPGKGNVVGIIPCGGVTLVTVWFHDPVSIKTYNAANLIRDNPRSVYNEAMRAEHRN